MSVPSIQLEYFSVISYERSQWLSFFPQYKRFIWPEGHRALIAGWIHIGDEEVCACEFFRYGKCGLMVGKAADYQELFLLQGPGVDEPVLAVLKQGLVFSVDHDGGLLAQGNQLFVIMEYGVRVCGLCLGIDLLIVWIDRDPGGAGGESGLLGIVPLHGGPGVVTAEPEEAGPEFLVGDKAALAPFLVGVDALNIPEI